MSISVKWISDTKEQGVIADASFNEGDRILVESPLVCCQYAYNKDFFPACSQCMRSLEGPEQLLKRLSGVPNVQLHGNKQFERISVKCGCGELYCSNECLQQARAYHRFMCNSPLLKQAEELWKTVHFPPETGTVMLMARMVALMMNEIETGRPREDVLSIFGRFKVEYFSSALNLLHRFMDDKFGTVLAQLRDLLREAFENSIPELFSDEGFRSLFSLMALNAQGVGTSSLEEYQRYALNSGDQQFQESLNTIEILEEMIEDVSGEFTHAEGSGLYLFHSKLNHSCEPNAEIRFPFNNATLEVVAIKPIAAGEEICIRYIDLGDDGDDECCDGGGASSTAQDAKSERKEILREYYLFDCQCTLCK